MKKIKEDANKPEKIKEAEKLEAQAEALRDEVNKEKIGDINDILHKAKLYFTEQLNNAPSWSTNHWAYRARLKILDAQKIILSIERF